METTASETEDDLYRILSLDGGGSWALIEAAALGDIYGLETPGKQILNHFNLAVANSGGSIVLAGLILNLSPSQILDRLFDETVRRGIFDKKFFDDYIFDTGFRKYKTESKSIGLRNAFQNNLVDTPLVEIKEVFSLKPDIIITAFGYDRERAKFFRSNGGSWAGGAERTVTLLQAIHASSTAPVKYFDDPAELQGVNPPRFWDGGVGGYNNPVMAGVIESLANSQNRDKIRVLSIGTGNNFLPLLQPGMQGDVLYKSPNAPGFFSDIRLLAGAIISDPPDAASFNAHVVLGGCLPDPNSQNKQNASTFVTNLIRMNPSIQPSRDANGQWAFPVAISRIDFIRLIKLGLDAVEDEDVKIIRRFAKAWLQDGIINQAIRADGRTLEHEIGHAIYSEALAHWRNYCGSVLTGENRKVNHQKVLKKLCPTV